MESWLCDAGGVAAAAAAAVKVVAEGAVVVVVVEVVSVEAGAGVFAAQTAKETAALPAEIRWLWPPVMVLMQKLSPSCCQENSHVGSPQLWVLLPLLPLLLLQQLSWPTNSFAGILTATGERAAAAAVGCDTAFQNY